MTSAIIHKFFHSKNTFQWNEVTIIRRENVTLFHPKRTSIQKYFCLFNWKLFCGSKSHFYFVHQRILITAVNEDVISSPYIFCSPTLWLIFKLWFRDDWYFLRTSGTFDWDFRILNTGITRRAENNVNRKGAWKKFKIHTSHYAQCPLHQPIMSSIDGFYLTCKIDMFNSTWAASIYVKRLYLFWNPEILKSLFKQGL